MSSIFLRELVVHGKINVLEPEICYGDEYQTYPMTLDHAHWQDQPIVLESFSGRNKHTVCGDKSSRLSQRNGMTGLFVHNLPF